MVQVPCLPVWRRSLEIKGCFDRYIQLYQSLLYLQPPNKSISQSINTSINQYINQSIHQSINTSINQYINQSINQSITVYLLNNQSKRTMPSSTFSYLHNQSIKHSIHSSINQTSIIIKIRREQDTGKAKPTHFIDSKLIRN